jgi:hypothetical protein
MTRRLASAVVLVTAFAACSDDGNDATLLTTAAPELESEASPTSAVSEPASPATAGPERASSTTPPPTLARPTTSAIADPGNFDSPVVTSAKSWSSTDFCDILPTDDRSLNDADFGNAAGPAEQMSGSTEEAPACLLQGANVGEISFAIVARTELPERATERASTRGSWSALRGNSSYVYCDDDDSIDDTACAAFVAVDDDHWLTVFVFMPTNDLDDLAAMTRAIAATALDHLPPA